MLVLFWRLEPLAEDVLWRRCVAGVRALFLSPENVRLIGKWKRVARLKTIGDVRWRCTLKTLAVLSLSLSLVEDESARSFVFFFFFFFLLEMMFENENFRFAKLLRRSWCAADVLSLLSLSLSRMFAKWRMEAQNVIGKWQSGARLENIISK